jgi:hypothetical protein
MVSVWIVMAYLRQEKEIVEMDYPLDKVWESIEKAIVSIEWKTEETDQTTHSLKVKTKANFMAYASTLTIEMTSSDEKATRVTVSAQTPVTTITGIVDFGRTSERINTFLLALVKQLKIETTVETTSNKQK